MEQKKEVLEQLKASAPKKIKLAVTDIDGVLRGKIISFKKFSKAAEGNLGFCNVIFGWDINDAVYDENDVTGWHTGFPDSMATIDLGTLRRIPWENDIPFFLADFHLSEDAGKVCPRTLLKTIRQQSLDMGYTPLFSNEFEWFNFRETPDSLKEKQYKSPQPLTPGMFGYSILRASQNSDYFNDLFDLLERFEVPLEGLHTETGDAVYEAAITYSDILEAADRAVLFKTGVKEIASRHQIIPSFMAKWNEQLPGCSGHIHQSLWDENADKNLFFEDKNSDQISELLEQYIAGQLHCMPHIMPMYAPVINSYKRLVPGSWAATSASWGIENRTTALRVINHGEESMRLETRVPGADANPYLSMAASLASGLYGIKHQLSLDTEKTTGNEYDNGINRPLPRSLDEAIQLMKSSDIAAELFGEEFTRHLAKTREWELRQYQKAVTDWELNRYFEII
ncbi:glutamine synthetase family protein [Gracilimonas mengyeensis]|uniref:Glutamine synthetase n=1 Tax=Gracilimonas mengyeensis TaxID=1302730 RepID=A0A521ADV5_9BACT|nr:glutamine synthetase family protein [Gracilimonas mengyeensis]SMO32880.1 glutamine synthetase [Gracilimonas mengyeensis]